jgi:hypothetical protein
VPAPVVDTIRDERVHGNFKCYPSYLGLPPVELRMPHTKTRKPKVCGESLLGRYWYEASQLAEANGTDKQRARNLHGPFPLNISIARDLIQALCVVHRHWDVLSRLACSRPDSVSDGTEPSSFARPQCARSDTELASCL